MHALRFDSAIDRILLRDRRYDPGAYFFLQDALDFTLKRTSTEGGDERHVSRDDLLKRHVSGEELLHGFRDCALQEFGPMAFTLLREWGVRTCSDVGEMVFHLIEEGMFGKQDSDTKEDFHHLFDFETVFRDPFLPSRPAPAPNSPAQHHS